MTTLYRFYDADLCLIKLLIINSNFEAKFLLETLYNGVVLMKDVHKNTLEHFLAHPIQIFEP